MLFLAGEAGVIDINGTVIVELLTFLVMFGLLARYVYPEIVKQAEARQRTIAEQLAAAEKARAEADAHLKEAQAKLGLKFGSIHHGPNYVFSNAREPAKNLIQISSGFLIDKKTG